MFLWLVVLWLEGRSGRIVSWQFVVPKDDEQDMCFPFKWSSPLVHGPAYLFRVVPDNEAEMAADNKPIHDEELRMDGTFLDL